MSLFSRSQEFTGTRLQCLANALAPISQALAPPERLTVAECAAKYRELNNKGSAIGFWDNNVTPYMVEPMNIMASRDFNRCAFIGPAQSGKTDAIILNGLLYNVVIDPTDTLIFSPTQSAAGDFSIRRIDKLNVDSTAMKELLITGRDKSNRFNKRYKTGMLATLSWPTISTLAGRPVPKVLITDRDRISDDIGGDGEVFDLAAKRTTTFGSYAMCMAESSPSRNITPGMTWIQSTPHEAPPVGGIVSLYNRGDRRKWYWPCPHCGDYFIGEFSLLRWNETDKTLSNYERSMTVEMDCPKCGSGIQPSFRYEMNKSGAWIKDGETISSDGSISGKGQVTKFASFWLNGTAAAFTTWQELVNTYLDACDDYKRTKSEEGLKKFYNNDIGIPYRFKAGETSRTPDELKSRSISLHDDDVIYVPSETRVLVAAVDIQKNSFVVQVYGVIPGVDSFDTVVVDRFHIKKSKRVDEDGDPMQLEPHAYLSDWDLIRERVMDAAYTLDDGSGRLMGVRMTVCDSGGYDGVTHNAYEFYRQLRGIGRHNEFRLVKGSAKPDAPRIKITRPDSVGGSARMSSARGDVPVLAINSNAMKDMLNGHLSVTDKGAGMWSFAPHLSDEFYFEMTAEFRTDKGWKCPTGVRNEAWDLSYYYLAACLMLNIHKMNWNSDEAPAWAKKLNDNSMVFHMETEGQPELEQNKEQAHNATRKAISPEDLAKMINGG